MINIAHLIEITPDGGSVSKFQNFFQNVSYDGYLPVPFSVQGSVAQLNGENDILRILFPFASIGVALVEGGKGNRLSVLKIITRWLETNDDGIPSPNDYAVVSEYTEYYIGIGASFSETTIELRFKSAMDSVNANFPARTLTRENAGILPVNGNVSFR